MKHTAKFLGLLAACAVGAFFGSRALSQRVTRPAGRCSLDTLDPQLRLTPRQRRLCARGDESFQRVCQGLNEELAQRQDRLLALLRQPKPEREELDAAMTAIAETQAKVQRAVVDQLLALKETLTPEQQEVLFDSLGQHMCGRLGAGMGRGQCGREGTAFSGRGRGPWWARPQDPQ